MAKENEEQKPLSHIPCTPAFDALWFCYSPVHQLKEYYREGIFDTCNGRWADLFHCFRMRTKTLSEAHAMMKERVKEEPHMWEFRTPEEAAADWNKEFSEEQQQNS